MNNVNNVQACYVEPWPYPNYPSTPWTPNDQWTPQTKNVKRTTKTIEKYDEQGKLVSREVVTTEEEVVQVYDNNFYYKTYSGDTIPEQHDLNDSIQTQKFRIGDYGTSGHFDCGHTLTNSMYLN